MKQLVDVADLSVVYLSYNEPQREEFWAIIQNHVPWAVRVDGVHGSDSAHKAAAAASETERFILIDGDNMPDWEFFNLTLEFTDVNQHDQLRWRARNSVNGVMYGNGGMSCWTREFINRMNTHENTDGTVSNNIEFCFDSRYQAMWDCYSTTHINYTPEQAWRAGFREGVKLCTRDGALAPHLGRFTEWVWPRNLRNLEIWWNLGADTEWGWWSQWGARLGTWMAHLSSWDYVQVRDFKYLSELWKTHQHDGQEEFDEVSQDLRQRLRCNIVDFSPEQSKFFKDHMLARWYNRGPMVTEMAVIREQEGW